jgi:integrase
MGRKSTGTVRILRNEHGEPAWHARWTRADGTRSDWLPLPDAIPVGACCHATSPECEHRRQAKATAARMAPKVRAASANEGKGETCDDYFNRLAKARAADGIRSVAKDRYTWLKWISPRIGKRPIAEVSRDEIEDVRNSLDAQVRKYLATERSQGISGKTAEIVWSILRTTFKAAISSRDRALRVRDDDPSAGHKPPLPTPDRAKTFFYPVEISKLVACKDVPLEWRETYAIATYLYVRPEELEALAWKDVDFTAGTISVNKTVDGRTHELKPIPKTDTAVRDVPIEPTLMPLLKAMHERRTSDDAPIVPVLRTLTDRYRAQKIRAHLVLADVERARLTTDTLTLRPVDFRSCRDTGITWLALSGLSLPAMQRRCGHKDIAQTNRYVKLAEDRSGTIGQPFPPLPLALLSGAPGTGSGSSGESPRIARGRFRGHFSAGKRSARRCCTATRRTRAELLRRDDDRGARHRTRLRVEDAGLARRRLPDRHAGALDDRGRVRSVQVGDRLDVGTQLLDHPHERRALLVAKRDGAVGATQRERLGRLQIADGGSEGGERRDGCWEVRVPSHLLLHVLGEHDEGRRVPGQGQGDGQAMGGRLWAKHPLKRTTHVFALAEPLFAST